MTIEQISCVCNLFLALNLASSGSSYSRYSHSAAMGCRHPFMHRHELFSAMSTCLHELICSKLGMHALNARSSLGLVDEVTALQDSRFRSYYALPFSVTLLQ